jgi:hypothetical protein
MDDAARRGRGELNNPLPRKDLEAMPLLNRPLTAAEIAALAAADLSTFYDSSIVRMIQEPRHSFVHYRAARGAAVYIKPSIFYVSCCPSSPSDSTWLVPGTEQR